MRPLFEQITHEQVTSNTYYEHELFLFTYLEGFSSRTALGSAPCSRRTYIDVRRTRSCSFSLSSIDFENLHMVCVFCSKYLLSDKSLDLTGLATSKNVVYSFLSQPLPLPTKMTFTFFGPTVLCTFATTGYTEHFKFEITCLGVDFDTS